MAEFEVATVLAAGEVTTLTLVDGKESDNSDALRAAVGGWLQVLDFVHPETGEVASVWMDEEGKYKRDAQVNWIASTLADMCNVGLMPGDKIVGNVVLTGMRESEDPEEGQVTSALSPNWWALLRTLETAVQQSERPGG